MEVEGNSRLLGRNVDVTIVKRARRRFNRKMSFTNRTTKKREKRKDKGCNAEFL